jgi:hypothetical protein
MGDIVDSAASRAASEAAGRLGRIQGSSYATADDGPVAWAFDVVPDDGPWHLVLAGSRAREQRLVMRAPEAHVFGVMQLARRLASGAEALAPHTVVPCEGGEDQGVLACYVTRQAHAGMRPGDVLVVALHEHEAGLAVDAAEPAVGQRTPELVSTPDPRSASPQYGDWRRLARTLRRIARLRELDSPAMIVDDVIDGARTLWNGGALAALAVWPADLRALATELGFLDASAR